MPKFYQGLGYAGLIPFIGFTVGLFALSNPSFIAACATMQVVYAGLIASFLAGMHWSHGLPRQHKVQLSLAMVPSIASLLLIFFCLLTYNYFIPLIVMGFMFIGLYAADKKLLEPAWLDLDYFKLRLRLTAIVSVCLFLSALSFWI